MRARLIVCTAAVAALCWSLAGRDTSHASADPPNANTDGARCVARCHRHGMRVVQWDGCQPWNNGYANNGALGCVCGEAP